MKKLFLTFLVLFSAAANAEMRTLDDYIKGNDWMSNPSDLAYVTTRCASLLSIVSGLAEANGESFDTKTKNNLELQANMYLELSQIFSKLAEITDAAYLERIKAITNIYAEKMAKNKRINNSVFSDFVGIDLKVCAESTSKKVDLIDTLADGK